MKLITSTGGIVRIMAAWSLILGVLNLMNLLILVMLAAGLETNQVPNQMQVWLSFGLNVIFVVGFFLSGYGLWRYQGWGRTLFLWIITAWAVFNIISLALSGGQYSFGALAVNILRFVVTLLVPLWYFHRPEVKTFFEGKKQTLRIEENL